MMSLSDASCSFGEQRHSPLTAVRHGGDHLAPKNTNGVEMGMSPEMVVSLGSPSDQPKTGHPQRNTHSDVFVRCSASPKVFVSFLLVCWFLGSNRVELLLSFVVGRSTMFGWGAFLWIPRRDNSRRTPCVFKPGKKGVGGFLRERIPKALERGLSLGTHVFVWNWDPPWKWEM